MPSGESGGNTTDYAELGGSPSGEPFFWVGYYSHNIYYVKLIGGGAEGVLD